MRNSIKILALITLGLFLVGVIGGMTDIGGAGILIFLIIYTIIAVNIYKKTKQNVERTQIHAQQTEFCNNMPQIPLPKSQIPKGMTQCPYCWSVIKKIHVNALIAKNIWIHLGVLLYL